MAALLSFLLVWYATCAAATLNADELQLDDECGSEGLTGTGTCTLSQLQRQATMEDGRSLLSPRELGAEAERSEWKMPKFGRRRRPKMGLTKKQQVKRQKELKHMGKLPGGNHRWHDPATGKYEVFSPFGLLQQAVTESQNRTEAPRATNVTWADVGKAVPTLNLPWAADDEGIAISDSDTELTISRDARAHMNAGNPAMLAGDAIMIGLDAFVSMFHVNHNCLSLGSGVKGEGSEEYFTKTAAHHFAAMHYNVMIIHNSQEIHTFQTGTDYCRMKNVEVCMDGIGARTKGYHMFVGLPGRCRMTITKLGDGGYRNWCFIGRFHRDGDTVQFY